MQQTANESQHSPVTPIPGEFDSLPTTQPTGVWPIDMDLEKEWDSDKVHVTFSLQLINLIVINNLIVVN